MVTDPDLKHGMENVPSAEDQTSPAPTTTIVFQQKLFSTGASLFQVSSVESTVITVNPPLVGLVLPSSSDLISMETSDMTPDFGNDALLEVAAITLPNTLQQIVLPSSQKDLTIPTLVSLAASLPYFQRSFIETSVPTSPKIENTSDEEILDRSHTCLMERMYFLDEVSACTQTRAQILALKL
ncbi:unnamed protein product [Lactuca virosa]|uniref:Uncharacterized protein n=1 Tax=Lactuca virosa TaxID=75947 RepID=A0AAU9M832_9ASTR|nr:unnamed protein product [Lactuca virosa]